MKTLHVFRGNGTSVGHLKQETIGQNRKTTGNQYLIAFCKTSSHDM